MTFTRRFARWTFAGAALVYMGAVAYAYLPHAEEPAATLAYPEDAFIDVAGLRHRILRFGDGDQRPTLLLLHGFAGSAAAFQQVGRALATTLNVVAVDLMPFGLSDKPADYEYSYAQQARTMGNLVEALGLDQVFVGGHSYGGTVAAYMAATDTRVAKLVLIDPGLHATGVPGFVEYLVFPFHRIGARMFAHRGFRQRFAAKSFVDPSFVDETFMDELMRAARMEGYLDGTTRLFARPVEVDVAMVENDVRVPTLLIWGAQDARNPPRLGRKLDDALADSRLIVVDGAGHYPHMEKPAVVARAIESFLRPAVEATESSFEGQTPRPDGVASITTGAAGEVGN